MLSRRRAVCLLVGFAMILSAAPALCAEEASQVQSPVVEADLFMPEPEDKLIQGPCTITIRCPDGSKKSCFGSISCGAGGPYVLCDGVRYYCGGGGGDA